MQICVFTFISIINVKNVTIRSKIDAVCFQFSKLILLVSEMPHFTL